MSGSSGEDFAPFLERWQVMIDLLARLSAMPYAMINRVDGDELVVQTLNAGAAGFKAADRFPLCVNTYCARALRNRAPLLVEDSRSLPEMDDNPTAQFGLVAYYGLPIRRPDGGLFGTICILDARPRRPEDDSMRLIGVMRDAIEQDLALLHKNAALAASEMLAQAARLEAERANRAKTDFLARINHELRTPLGAMLGFAQLLELDQAPALSPGQRQRVAHIRHAGDHLLALVEEMLDVSSIETGQLLLQPGRCELAPQIREALAQCQAQADAAGVSLHAPAEAPAVRADARRLHQVLLNLLSNAIKYNRRGGEVRLSCAQQQGRVWLSVQDSGLGMDEAQLAQLFQPFNRLGREHSGIAGTGLGLALCRQLLELMDGRIEVSSAPGLGTTVRVDLPLA
jgi:signal transduction histidine kinase